ncbi:hypothetical protein DOTSEDRAFT_172484 [Dothistroma septosporum NZE10]|uniref:DUF605-domain-containing protein n=1 Tax=Dothistroma septosporum (strain NZE10 / CBS 128990) TaxID=675120 RepID=N1PN41_DOTSN|nr:hypothetical protein DOTSEDRAFT_172484 [Dothistroma septosporum NZE10]
MAAALPAKLKTAAPDVGRFATRAAQLEKFRPIVSYWCEYYILQKVLEKQLHTTDEECTTYAIQLMDKLEQYKSENSTNDAVVDDVAAKAYVENFALETFNKGDEAQRSNKVTKQTADTFQASATFMDLLGIWGPVESEIQAKSKFAKFHALRIAKAIKAGEDPNSSNPVIEEPAQPDDLAMDDGLEQELKNLENDAGVYKQPTVESAAESRQPSRPHSITQNDVLPPPTLPTGGTPLMPQAEPDVSPIDQAEDINSRAGSIGGGYFPAVPGEVQSTDAPPNVNSIASVEQPPSAPSAFATSDPADLYGQPRASPSASVPGDLEIGTPNRPDAPTPHQMQSQQPSAPLIYARSPLLPAAAPQQAPKPRVQPVVSAGPPPGGYRTDDDSVMAAQKHAKWAISALNFEDVNTAVQELRIALNSLGAS